MQDAELTRLQESEQRAQEAYMEACAIGCSKKMRAAWSVVEGAQAALRSKQIEVERAEAAPRLLEEFPTVSLARI